MPTDGTDVKVEFGTSIIAENTMQSVMLRDTPLLLTFNREKMSKSWEMLSLYPYCYSFQTNNKQDNVPQVIVIVAIHYKWATVYAATEHTEILDVGVQQGLVAEREVRKELSDGESRENFQMSCRAFRKFLHVVNQLGNTPILTAVSVCVWRDPRCTPWGRTTLTPRLVSRRLWTGRWNATVRGRRCVTRSCSQPWRSWWLGRSAWLLRWAWLLCS